MPQWYTEAHSVAYLRICYATPSINSMLVLDGYMELLVSCLRWQYGLTKDGWGLRSVS